MRYAAHSTSRFEAKNDLEPPSNQFGLRPFITQSKDSTLPNSDVKHKPIPKIGGWLRDVRIFSEKYQPSRTNAVRPIQPKMAKPSERKLEPLSPTGAGQPIPDVVRRKMESSFGTDFSDVRIHRDDNASRIGALAYTQGKQIHFAPGQYNPLSTQGQRILGHELTHVVQQRTGRVSNPQWTGTSVNADPELEGEADALGAKAVSGYPINLEGKGYNLAATSAGTPIQCYCGPGCTVADCEKGTLCGRVGSSSMEGEDSDISFVEDDEASDEFKPDSGDDLDAEELALEAVPRRGGEPRPGYYPDTRGKVYEKQKARRTKRSHLGKRVARQLDSSKGPVFLDTKDREIRTHKKSKAKKPDLDHQNPGFQALQNAYLAKRDSERRAPPLLRRHSSATLAAAFRSASNHEDNLEALPHSGHKKKPTSRRDEVSAAERRRAEALLEDKLTLSPRAQRTRDQLKRKDRKDWPAWTKQ